MPLIAKQRVIVHHKGERAEIEPGQEVTGLSKVDAEALIASGFVEDTAVTEAQAKADAKAAAAAAKEFQAARAEVSAQSASVEAPAAAKPAK